MCVIDVRCLSKLEKSLPSIFFHRHTFPPVSTPAIVSDVNADGTFDLVHLEHARLEKHVRREQFQPYHVLPQGTLAFYQESPGEYLPITIVGFVRESARVNFEIHGKYQFVLNGDESNEVREGNASMIHSVA
mmetsp:Transcript_13818/g.30014  ORF Transcript_13818/g.30014 Transcript_13818/m.30014 type:complete len:132 (+) Transcript_13818:804-1199(+)